MSRVGFAYVQYKKAILNRAEVQKLREAEQELREALKNITDEDISYLIHFMRDAIYTDEAFRKKAQKLEKAEEFIKNIKEKFETFKL
jgi:succinate dehydrogenase/fumarate reductase flavoprotein subunit